MQGCASMRSTVRALPSSPSPACQHTPRPELPVCTKLASFLNPEADGNGLATHSSLAHHQQIAASMACPTLKAAASLQRTAAALMLCKKAGVGGVVQAAFMLILSSGSMGAAPAHTPVQRSTNPEQPTSPSCLWISSNQGFSRVATYGGRGICSGT